MKDYQQYDVRFWFKIKHVLNDEDKVIEWNETNYSYEMRIYEFATTYLSIWHQFSLYLNSITILYL